MCKLLKYEPYIPVKIITTSFCMVKNREALVKVNKDEIRVMNGIRFLSAVCIVILHVVFYMALSGLSNLRDIDLYLEGIGGIFFHYDLIVDTFFTISGLLHMKGLLNRRQNLFGVLWKRYIRLIGPFALIVFYIISVSEHFSPGPGWFGWEETSICENYWLQNLFMINLEIGQICHAVSWYVCCDYQLAILATVLFFFYKLNKISGYTVYIAVAILSMVIPGVLTYLLQMPAMPYMEYGKYILRFREIWQFNHIYISFYGRGGPYVVGIAMGYIMGIYKPADYRKSVTKTWSIITMAVSLSGLAVMMALGYIIINFIPLEPGVVAGTSRIIWAAAICGVVGMCEYGTVPVIPSILGWSVFTPLSRLSYGIYMIHTLVVQRHKLSQRSPHLFDIYCILVDSAGVLAVSIALSYAMWLFVEAPLININNYIFFNRLKGTESDKRSGENGVQHQNGVANTNVL
ncbi:unnamed protein product [Spodoptera littoralis]|uniref:Acyltransferase 3 domain-containing protein n=1 Tax=Spodoptera littoralis TaxID=7109 RepID=A0A9P0I819_SPOLI|nr:unnamed protein product [Spodoptera littoralis]CAH1641712.1 unnamed protein product [Spodoptera littoralis]